MGINIGAFICNIIAAFMRNKFGWGEAFITAGVGMLIGMVIFTIGKTLHPCCSNETCTGRRYQAF
jgi:POT family proton-dependent oligopeptide transporter